MTTVFTLSWGLEGKLPHRGGEPVYNNDMPTMELQILYARLEAENLCMDHTALQRQSTSKSQLITMRTMLIPSDHVGLAVKSSGVRGKQKVTSLCNTCPVFFRKQVLLVVHVFNSCPQCLHCEAMLTWCVRSLGCIATGLTGPVPAALIYECAGYVRCTQLCSAHVYVYGVLSLLIPHSHTVHVPVVSVIIIHRFTCTYTV